MRSFNTIFLMLFTLVLIEAEGAAVPGAGTAASTSPTATKYLGTATIDVWYGGLGLQTLQRRYQQNVTLYIDHPLLGEANAEDNPFHYQATTPEAPGQPGAFSIYSAYLYIPDIPETPTVVWQYWWYLYSETEENYQGTYNPDPSNKDNFNIIVGSPEILR